MQDIKLKVTNEQTRQTKTQTQTVWWLPEGKGGGGGSKVIREQIYGDKWRFYFGW